MTDYPSNGLSVKQFVTPFRLGWINRFNFGVKSSVCLQSKKKNQINLSPFSWAEEMIFFSAFLQHSKNFNKWSKFSVEVKNTISPSATLRSEKDLSNFFLICRWRKWFQLDNCSFAIKVTLKNVRIAVWGKSLCEICTPGIFFCMCFHIVAFSKRH